MALGGAKHSADVAAASAAAPVQPPLSEFDGPAAAAMATETTEAATEAPPAAVEGVPALFYAASYALPTLAALFSENEAAYRGASCP